MNQVSADALIIQGEENYLLTYAIFGAGDLNDTREFRYLILSVTDLTTP